MSFPTSASAVREDASIYMDRLKLYGIYIWIGLSADEDTRLHGITALDCATPAPLWPLSKGSNDIQQCDLSKLVTVRWHFRDVTILAVATVRHMPATAQNHHDGWLLRTAAKYR